MTIGVIKEMVSGLLRRRSVMVWEIRRMGEELLVKSGVIAESELGDDWDV